MRVYQALGRVAVLGNAVGRWEYCGALKAFCLLADLEKQKAGLRADADRAGFSTSSHETYLFGMHYPLTLFELV